MCIIFYFQFFNIMYKSTIEYIIQCEPINGCIIDMDDFPYDYYCAMNNVV